MLSAQDAVTDEPVEGAVTREHVGRQCKRIRTSSLLSTAPDHPEITDGTVGDRFVAATSMAVELMVNREEPVENQLVAAVGAALRIACRPRGAICELIRNEIQIACAPRGAIYDLIRNEIQIGCAPRGAIYDLIRNEIQIGCAPGGAICELIKNSSAVAESRSLARLQNGRVFQATGAIAPLPNQANQMPPSFPDSYLEYDSMNAAAVNGLLAFYRLPDNGAPGAKKRRLAAFCNVNIPS